ncbi:hypothetical protein C8R46DRAFT_901899, partial [Mycena filopes]
MKTYQAFASVFEVFDRNSEQVSEENVEGTVKAKNLMRQMINSMSTKLEIGSPMASMYVLGNPDHYSSHKFVNFWWRTYVTFIKRHWAELEGNPMDNDDENPHEERITIKNQNGTFVALSPVDDYRYRPIAYESVNLYEWIQCSDKKSRNKKEREQYFEHLNFKKDLQTSGSDDGADGSDASDDESELDDFIVHDGNSDTSSSEEEDFDSDDDSDWSLNDEDDMHTHGVHCDFTRLDSMIPNFLGGAIPRADKGNREYYCMTIMTLFKPWRTPSDLKDVFSTWDQTFLDHTFTSRQVQLISNFNIRCNDARDDHFALMKKKLAEAELRNPSYRGAYLGRKDEFLNDLEGVEYTSDEHIIDDEPGPRSTKLAAEAESIRSVLQSASWLNACRGPSGARVPERCKPDYKPRMSWVNIVKHQRELYTSNKLANMPPPENRHDDPPKKGSLDRVDILPPNYFDRPHGKFTPEETVVQIHDVCNTFCLNEEQERAFKIVADHASGSPSEPLKMYIGGMGGSGKSQVFKAIIAFFATRKEDYRFMVLGPTGSTAALVNGST